MKKTFHSKYVQIILLILILFVSGFLRMRGIKWDENYHLHPDERFLTMVESSIYPVHSLSEYFDTSTSTLNPNNMGHTFFVYGTFPIFLVRYAAEWFQQTGYSEVHIVGRYLSAIFDLGVVLLVYFIAEKLFKKPFISLLSALFYGLATLSIQQSHFFTVDTFASFFVAAALYLAICIFTLYRDKKAPDEKKAAVHDLWLHVLFGFVAGLAAASKINAVICVLLLPLADILRDYPELKQSPQKRTQTLINLAVAAFVCLLTFRIFQPYAFQGPSFFGFSLNQNWLNNLREQSVYSSGDINYPPSVQWARRPFYFAWQNLLLWGFGLPIGIPALIGLLVMGWEIIKGNWKPYFLLWIWIVLYGGWQSQVWNPTMRYMLYVYPGLAICAAWLVVKAVDWLLKEKRIFKIVLAGCLLTVLLGGSAAWAFSFSEIYTRPVTRVAATEWIYKNVEGPINLEISTLDEDYSQALSYPHYIDLTLTNPITFTFSPAQDQSISALLFEKIQNTSGQFENQALMVNLYEIGDGEPVLLQSTLVSLVDWNDSNVISSQLVMFSSAQEVQQDKEYQVEVELSGQSAELRFYGFIQTSGYDAGYNSLTETIFECAPSLSQMGICTVQFTPFEEGMLTGVTLFRVLDWEGSDEEKEIRVRIQSMDAEENVFATGTLTSAFNKKQDYRGSEYSITLDEPILLQQGKVYSLTLETDQGEGNLAIYGSKRLNESSWDDGLPLYMYGYDPFNENTGVYYSDLNLELYYDDDASKLERFYTSLEEADYIYITSNRQWGSTTQIPERYPLTVAYYRALLGCPVDQDLQDCYRDAQPGMYSGELGFELVEVFQSEPAIGNLTINTQYAEEAFTVYDHPKVLIFKKTDSFDMTAVRLILGKVDLSKAMYLTPAAASETPGDLSLTESQEEIQTSGGTWSELFSRDSLLNQSQLVGILVWYLVLFLLGVVVYPTTRVIFRGLKEKGYAFSRLFGMLLLAFLVWLLGSLSMPAERWLISLVFAGILGINGWLYWKNRKAIRQEFKENRKYFLQVEAVFLAFFIFFTLIRLGNPDLWHEYKGGEKPMDFAYFNAIVKSTIFPPYDPWYAGGYINYYYFGSLIAGIYTKWLGIIPSIAYNFSLATFFAFVGTAAFGIGWNFQSKRLENKTDKKKFSPFMAGIIFAAAVLIIGNLGTINMILSGFKQIAINVGLQTSSGIFSSIAQGFKGLFLWLKGAKFTYYPGDWYWIPSRAIPGEAITEFPYFTFLYGDPHAHLFAYPITLMALGFAISIVFRQKKFDGQRDSEWLFALLGGGLIVGCLAAVNTWDYPVYLLFGLLAIIYEHFKQERYYPDIFPQCSQTVRIVISCVISLLLFAGSSYLFFQLYHSAYGAGYTSIQGWEGTHTPLTSLIVHWGIFLFFIISWLIIKTRDWLAETPISFIKTLRSYQPFLWVVGFVLFGMLIWLLAKGVMIALVMLPLLVWAFLLFINKKTSLLDRVILLFQLAGFAMILMVEVIVLTGDVGRMNTVFKFYLQAWTFLAISAAYGFVDLLPRLWKPAVADWKKAWHVCSILLVGCGLLFPIAASMDKITDRISDTVPLTLDGMDYMQSAIYWQDGIEMDLEQDYQGILWMQENIQGSPVIVEGTSSLYQWGNRYSIYTGLPAVIGWDWHQRQQKTILPSNWVTDRITEVEEFYNTTDVEAARSFLDKYEVKYIVVGQLERIRYAEEGLQKFSAYEGVYWRTVFSYKDTIILEVME